MRDIQKAMVEINQRAIKEADEIILEYMRKRSFSLKDLQGNVIMQAIPDDKAPNVTKLNYWYKGELILSVISRVNYRELIVTCEYSIKKGDW